MPSCMNEEAHSEQYCTSMPGGDSSAACPAEVVSLCVGGVMFSATRGTLTAVPVSYLAMLFGGSHWKPSSLLPGSDTPFVDRDGELFRYVLAYLRHVRNSGPQQQLPLLPHTPLELQQLRAEADFYGLPGLAAICSLGRAVTHPKAGRVAALLQQQQQPQQQQQQPLPGMLGQAAISSAAAAGNTAHGRQGGADVAQLPLLPQAALQHQHQEQQQQDNSKHSSSHQHAVSASDIDLKLHMQQLSGCSPLAAAMVQAQQVAASQQQRWAQDATLQQFVDIVLKHMLQLPMAESQPDLVNILAQTEHGSKLEFRFAYYPVGDTRIDIQCRALPAGAEHASAIAAAAAVAGATVAAAGGGASPSMSPRDSRQLHQRVSSTDGPAAGGAAADGAAGGAASRAYSGSLSPEVAGVAAVAAAAAAAAAVNSYSGSAVVPGPGWGHPTMYHRFTIKETLDKFVLTTHSPGEPQDVREMAHAAFRPELKRYSSLHKLCVQQCPRTSVAGLMWLLEEAGFSTGVQLSTSLETYYVGRNTFTGYTSTIICSL